MDFMDTAAAVLLGNLLTLAAFFTLKRLEKVESPVDTPWWAILTGLLIAFVIAGTAFTELREEEAESRPASELRQSGASDR